MIDRFFFLISRLNITCLRMKLISRLINRSGLRISDSKVFSSEGITEMKRLSIESEIKDARCGYQDDENPTQKLPALILTDFNPTTRTPPAPPLFSTTRRHNKPHPLRVKL